jgi:hypothetical protein
MLYGWKKEKKSLPSSGSFSTLSCVSVHYLLVTFVVDTFDDDNILQDLGTITLEGAEQIFAAINTYIERKDILKLLCINESR